MACPCWLLIIQDSVLKPLPGKAFTDNSVCNNPCHLIFYPNYYSLNHKLSFQSIYLLCPSFPSFNDISVSLAFLFFLCLNQRLVHKSDKYYLTGGTTNWHIRTDKRAKYVQVSSHKITRAKILNIWKTSERLVKNPHSFLNQGGYQNELEKLLRT